MKKYDYKFRIEVTGGTPDLLFYAPSKELAIFYTEMCGYTVTSATEEA